MVPMGFAAVLRAWRLGSRSSDYGNEMKALRFLALHQLAKERYDVWPARGFRSIQSTWYCDQNYDIVLPALLFA